ncbi:hypothetical protein M011DRAFT_4197 [Sporormia fimetaria CBS 119925]|uniref:Uncharacterized protein n=1 Tax=Sporormia fimetaria CBS 119925 TaxID=1340428 RepID=A0A6A6VNK3_9PLEO|nr:hypothetical protein M011DRAFT_4197 [Sporormia fimetaria CBS 119925]
MLVVNTKRWRQMKLLMPNNLGIWGKGSYTLSGAGPGALARRRVPGTGEPVGFELKARPWTFQPNRHYVGGFGGASVQTGYGLSHLRCGSAPRRRRRGCRIVQTKRPQAAQHSIAGLCIVTRFCCSLCSREMFDMAEPISVGDAGRLHHPRKVLELRRSSLNRFLPPS